MKRVGLLELPLPQAVWRLALPAMGALLLRFTNHAVAQYWIGRLDGAAVSLAAVSAANFLVWLIYAWAALFNTGLQALVARSVGAGDHAAHASAMRHGISLALLLGACSAAVALPARHWVLGFQNLQPDVQAVAAGYLAVLFLGLPVSYVGMALETCFRAEGDTVTPFRVALVTVTANAVLAPLFIQGWGGLPPLGVRGAALVTVGVQLVGMLVLAGLHRRREVAAPGPLQVAQWWRLLRLGLAPALAGTVFSSVYVALVRILAPFGSAPVAALGLGHTIEGLPFFLCVGFGVAASTLVGQNVGAGQPDQAARAAWQVLRFACLVLLPVALLYGTFAPHCLRFFMDPVDPDVLRYGTQYLRVAAAVQVIGGCECVLRNAQIGAGETTAPTLVDLAVTLGRIPLAWLLARYLEWGPVGVWVSIGTMTCAGALGQTWLFQAGHWRRREI
ncbi:MAG: MATE family efflux transporter [Fimbriimonadaceae bacterium]|nr:MATE family efflux transporter [Fimbriimonadaceae bacterium]